MSGIRTVQIQIRAWSENGDGVFRTYKIPVSGEMDVLNALEHVRSQIDPTLAYRSSCRRGVCGGCLMMIEGKLRLACQTPLHEGMKVDPFRTR